MHNTLGNPFQTLYHNVCRKQCYMNRSGTQADNVKRTIYVNIEKALCYSHRPLLT